MAPKKSQKMSLGAFLEDNTLGSWADEMDALPTAPAPKEDDGGYGDRGYGRRDDFSSSRSDRAPFPPREDVPLPTRPPFNAFVGNISFDVSETHLESFFEHPDGIKSAKVIRDHAESSRGFGYVEFNSVEGLKEALKKSGTQFMSRNIRVNVADPPKERTGGGFGYGDDDKFSGNWRRDGPLPEAPGRDGGSRRRYDGLASEANRESVSEGNENWRSNRPARTLPEADVPPVRRRGSGFSTPHEGESSPADAEDKWTIGSKFKAGPPAGEGQTGGRFGSTRGKGDMGPPPAPSVADESDWRRPKPSRNSSSPTNSVPPTPQMGRRKLELLPRATSGSTQPTPLSSPKSAGFSSSASKPNPFGAAKPVDNAARDAVIQERLEKEKVERSQHSMSRQSSRQPRQRPAADASASEAARSPVSPGANEEGAETASPRIPGAAAATVRPAFSFASAAARKVSVGDEEKDPEEETPASKDEDSAVDTAAEQVAEVEL